MLDCATDESRPGGRCFRVAAPWKSRTGGGARLTTDKFGANVDAPIEKVPLPDWPHQELLYETIDNGRIALITMNRPERMNSSDPDMGFRWYGRVDSVRRG